LDRAAAGTRLDRAAAGRGFIRSAMCLRADIVMRGVIRSCLCRNAPIDDILQLNVAGDNERGEGRMRRWHGRDDGRQIGPTERAEWT
jgi:hypothetical protein